MSSFTSALIVKRLGAPRQWEVVTPFVYEVGAIGSGLVITVPAGFVTDFASIPRPLWWLWPPAGGSYDQAGALHDYLYRVQFANLERVVADAVLLEAMDVLGVPVLERRCIYLGVRLGGWVTYQRYRRLAAHTAERDRMTLNIDAEKVQAAIKAAADAQPTNTLEASGEVRSDRSGEAEVLVKREWTNGWAIGTYAKAWWTGDHVVSSAAGVKVTKTF